MTPDILRKKPRSLGRRLAMQYLFARDLCAGVPEPVERFLDTQRAVETEAGAALGGGAAARDWDEAAVFARELAEAVLAHRDELDQQLSSVAEHWEVNRIAAVERNILRLAAWELRAGDVDAPVALDEAIRLAKLFGGKESGGFVNGVLDSLVRR